MNNCQYNKSTVVKRLKVLRKNYEMTQERFAEKLGVSESTYKKIEQGKISPSLEFMYKVSVFSGLPIEAFFGEDDNQLEMAWRLTENLSESGQIVIAVRVVNKVGEEKFCEIIGRNKKETGVL